LELGVDRVFGLLEHPTRQPLKGIRRRSGGHVWMAGTFHDDNVPKAADFGSSWPSAGSRSVLLLRKLINCGGVLLPVWMIDPMWPGPDGLNAKLLKNAYLCVEAGDHVERHYMFGPVLCRLYNALYTSGKYVRDWSCATLSAVERGDAKLLNYYRALALGSVLEILYAVILDARFSVCAEKNGGELRGMLVSGQATVQWTMSWFYGTSR
jgi:hypothetical protein